MNKPVRVGITHGDINGIGYEVILKTFADERMLELCTPVIFGSTKLMSYYRKVLEMEELTFHSVASAADAPDHRINVVNISDEEIKVDMGKATPESGAAALKSLELATAALAAGELDVLVTAPINKRAIQSEAFRFNGHTEYLESKASEMAEEGAKRPRSLMVLFSDRLRVALATNHLPLSEVSAALTPELLKGKLLMFDHSLRKDFGVDHPTIAVLSLNPHNGDEGLLGKEEQEVIRPVVEELAKAGVLVFGPFAADGFFGTGAYAKYDGVMAMYHDQGLAPFKAIAGGDGVNFTAGLPFVRTSPDHGTGYDLTGKNLADADSFRRAVYEAIDIARRREEWARARRNPLRKQYVERGADKTVDLSKEEM